MARIRFGADPQRTTRFEASPPNARPFQEAPKVDGWTPNKTAFGQSTFKGRGRGQVSSKTGGKIKVGEDNGNDIMITPEQHERLVQHQRDRYEFMYIARQAFIDRLDFIDRQLAGHIILDEDDRIRAKKNMIGRSITPVDFNLQLTAAQIDELVTYTMNVLCPEENVYEAVLPPDLQEQGKALITLMNKHAKDFGHQLQFAKGFRDGYAYNFGGWMCNWTTVEGNKLKPTASGGVEVLEDQVIRSGNEIPAIDPYNFLWDPSVEPIHLARKGEYFGCVELMTPFRLKKARQDKKLFNVERAINETTGGGVITRYWKPRPTITYDGVRSIGGKLNWHSILTGTEVAGVSDRHEIVRYVGWIVPAEFGLSKSKQMEIWEIKLLNDQDIVFVEKKKNAHEQLPVTIIMPNYDGNEMQAKSVGETLIPLQRFASQQFNIHQRSARKQLLGLIVYDEQQIPMFAKADMLGGKIPARPSSQDRNLRNAFARVDDAPVNDQTLSNVSATMDIMQKLFPTDMLQQVASLERATEYQAAATVQGANRKNQKYALTINQQAIIPLKNMQLYNIYQFGEPIQIVDEQSGERVSVVPSALAGQELEWSIGAGLKGLDRMIVASSIKEVIISIVQNPEAAQEVDLIRIIDYMMDLLGDKTNFGDFRIKTPFDKLTPEQKQMAFQLLQQAQLRAQQQGGQNAPASLPAPG